MSLIRVLDGELLEKKEDYCIVIAYGVGYKIFIPYGCYEELPAEGERVKLHTHMSVREDAITMYGFLNPEQLTVFELIINVSGIGPKIAMALVGRIKPTQFYLSVLNEQVAQFTSVPGIGKKSAQRIILELKEKVNEITSSYKSEDMNAFQQGHKVHSGETSQRNMTDELKAALSALGYTNREIEHVITSVKGSITEEMEMEQLLRMALQKLNQ